MEAEILQRFLESVGGKADVDLYLHLFREQKKESFAILAVDAPVVRSALDPLHFDLRILAGLGLCPVVFLGLVEPAEAVAQARRAQEWLVEDGVAARVLEAGDVPELVTAVREAIVAGAVPIVAVSDRVATVDRRFALLAELASALATRKIVFLGSRAGLGRAGVVPPSVVNLGLDHDALVASGGLTRKQAALLSQVKLLLESRVRHRMSVAVTNPLHLLRELFTVKGAGTLIRLGSRIDRHEGLLGVDLARLTALLESAFGHRLDPAFLARPVDRSYVEEAYQGAALFVQTPVGWYLTKFAVERQAQGEGIGRDLWTVICRETPAFFWRARPGNPILPWYVQQCDGMQRLDDWHVFWKGLRSEGADRAPALVRWALEAPVDFGPARG